MKASTNHCRTITKSPPMAQTALALKLDAYLVIIQNMFFAGVGLWSTTTLSWWAAWLDIIGGENLDIFLDDDDDGGGDDEDE